MHLARICSKEQIIYSIWKPSTFELYFSILFLSLYFSISFILQNSVQENLFINYLSRIHRDDDFHFIMQGFTKLLNNPLVQTYLPNSTKKIQFHQELLVFFWKICDYNKVKKRVIVFTPFCCDVEKQSLFFSFRNFYILCWRAAMYLTFLFLFYIIWTIRELINVSHLAKNNFGTREPVLKAYLCLFLKLESDWCISAYLFCYY